MQIDIQGIPTHYTVSGKGEESVVILPGWGATSAVYTLLIQQLSEAYTVYALDLPGFGITPEPPEAWSVADYTQFVRSFLEACQLHRVILIGHSYGGRILLRLCSEPHALEIPRIVLIDSAGIKAELSAAQKKRQARFKKRKKLLESKPMRLLFPNALTKLQSKYGSADYAAASPIMRQCLVKAISDDLRDRLPDITVPVLLIWGEKDTVTPLRDAQIMQKSIPHATLEVLPDAGHFPFVDQPFAFRRILRAHFGL